jgi:hypothetical protein
MFIGLAGNSISTLSSATTLFLDHMVLVLMALEYPSCTLLNRKVGLSTFCCALSQCYSDKIFFFVTDAQKQKLCCHIGFCSNFRPKMSAQKAEKKDDDILIQLDHLKIQSREAVATEEEDEEEECSSNATCITCCATNIEKQNLHQETIQALEFRLEHLYFMIAQPQIIHIYNFDELVLRNHVTNIKDRVETLFFEAHIPNHWKMNVTWTIRESDFLPDIIIVHITLISYLVKMKTKQILCKYLENNYNNTVYLK